MAEKKVLNAWSEDNNKTTVTHLTVIPISELDEKVERFSAAPHHFWVDEYLQLKERRHGRSRIRDE